MPPLDPIRHIVRNRMPTGVIFSKAETFDERIRFLLDNDFPFVSHGRSLWPEPHPFVDSTTTPMPMAQPCASRQRGAARCPSCCRTAR
jgi:hypothetical protein